MWSHPFTMAMFSSWISPRQMAHVSSPASDALEGEVGQEGVRPEVPCSVSESDPSSASLPLFCPYCCNEKRRRGSYVFGIYKYN
jgi:hypothetical protein